VNLKFFGEVYVTLLVIVDPPGMVPVFLALTGTMTARARMQAATQAVGLALGVIVGFAVAGQTLLDYLHVKLPALQGAGGLLLVLVALQLLTGKTDEPSEQGGTSNVALVPIGTPLLAGPGAIVATMLFVRRADGFADYLVIGLGIVAVMATV
jgi:multiple antibiotic resistance protein